MSRIGKKPIEIPSAVEIKKDGDFIKVKGPKGELSQKVDKNLEIDINETQLVVKRPNDTKKMRSLHGLTRALIQNMVIGVTDGYKKELEIVGTGYRAAKQGDKLVLTLGFSHPLELKQPSGLTVEVPGPNRIVIEGSDKQQVGAYAAHIRNYRAPEPYKGKGIKYIDERIRRKVGKTGK